MKHIFLATLITLLLGCSSIPELYLSDEPIEVTNPTVSDYWVRQNEEFSFRWSPVVKSVLALTFSVKKIGP